MATLLACIGNGLEVCSYTESTDEGSSSLLSVVLAEADKRTKIQLLWTSANSKLDY